MSVHFNFVYIFSDLCCWQESNPQSLPYLYNIIPIPSHHFTKTLTKGLFLFFIVDMQSCYALKITSAFFSCFHRILGIEYEKR